MGILSFLILLPIVGAIVLALLPDDPKIAKIIGLAFGSATLIASLVVLANTQSLTYHFQLVENIAWVPELGIQYHLGVDGISVWLLVLTAFLTLVALGYSLYVDLKVRSFMALILLLEAAMLGSFVSLDLVLFFTFFEATLIPMWLMINTWGGHNRAYAANKFLIYTFAGSIFLFVGMVALAVQMASVSGHPSFDIVEIQNRVANGSLWVGGLQLQTLIFWGFALAFLVKTPAFPFHTWIGDAYSEAPTAAPILSSAMVKMGTYGFLRFALPLFPEAARAAAPCMMGLAVIGIIYGAIVAAVQPDLRRLLAYSSLSHMGFILLGIFSLSFTGMMGGAYQQLNHGVSTAAMFILVGFLALRRETTRFKDLGGLKSQMPIFAALFLVAMLANVGLPGTNGFVGEFLSLMGAFESGYAGLYHLGPIYAILAAGGVVLAAAYLLYMFQQVCAGPNLDPLNRRLRDLTPIEVAAAGSLVLLILWGGLEPSTFTNPMQASIQATRLMAINPVGQRPVWDDPSLEVEMDSAQEDPGALVRANPNREMGTPTEALAIVAPSRMRAVPPPNHLAPSVPKPLAVGMNQ